MLPQLYPALGGAALLTFMTSLASFSAPYIFGGGFRVMPTQIVATRLNGDDRLAMVETISLTVLALGALWVFRGAGTATESAGGRKGEAPARIPVRGRSVRLAAGRAGLGLAAVLLLPHLTLMLVSFVPLGTWTIEPIPPAYTLKNYVTLVAGPGARTPAGEQSVAGDGGDGGGGRDRAGRRAAERAPPGARSARLIEALLALPWAVPGTVFAIALATAFSVHAPWTGRFVLVGTAVDPSAGVSRTESTDHQSRPPLGRARARPVAGRGGRHARRGSGRTLRRVTLPLLRPALLAGASLAFVTAFGDFVTSIMLYTYDTRPISLEILSSLRQSDVGVAAAYGVVLMLVSAAVFAIGADRGSAG